MLACGFAALGIALFPRPNRSPVVTTGNDTSSIGSIGSDIPPLFQPFGVAPPVVMARHTAWE